MGTLYVFVIIVTTLSTHCSAYFVSHSETDYSTASVLLKEGQSAEILCMTKGTGDFFWWKGETLYISTLVASFTVGEVSDDSQPYSVTANGTLHIRSVTLKDEGNYFCRVSSTENECYGEVKILVQASLRNFELAIDRCDRESSCLLYLDPSQSTSVTCTALNAPHLMTLKWFNWSEEITEGIVQNELLPPNGNSREITSTVTAVYGRPASLTCQAVDPKRGNDDVRFAHAQVELTVPFIEILPSWIIVSVTSAGCFIVFGICLLIKAKVNRKHRKKYTKLKKKDAISLTVSAESKDRELFELKGKLRQIEEELKKSMKENIELQGDLESKAKSIAELEDKLRQQEEEINEERNAKIELQITSVIAEGETTVVEELAERRNKEISDLKSKLKEKDSELGKISTERTNLKTNLQKKEIALQGMSDEISDLKSKLKEKDTELEEISKELTNLKSKLKEKDTELEGISKELTNLKEDLAKKEREEQKSSERSSDIKQEQN